MKININHSTTTINTCKPKKSVVSDTTCTEMQINCRNLAKTRSQTARGGWAMKPTKLT